MVLSLLPAHAQASASDAQWEVRLTQAWNALSSKQQSILKPNERVWIKYKDSLNEFDRHQELITRTDFLKDYKIDSDGALEKERDRLDWHTIEANQKKLTN